jgi:hypothetical protein
VHSNWKGREPVQAHLFDISFSLRIDLTGIKPLLNQRISRMKSVFDGRRRFSILVSCLLGFAATLSSASLLSGCGDDKGQTPKFDPNDNPSTIAKDSMNFYKDAHTKGGAAKKK